MTDSREALNTGQSFVKNLIRGTLVLFVLYVGSHIYFAYFKGEDGVGVFDTNFKLCVDLKPTGEMILIDPQCVMWIVGEEMGSAILKRMEQRTSDIRIYIEKSKNRLQKLQAAWFQVIGGQEATAINPVPKIQQYFLQWSCPDRCDTRCDKLCSTQWDIAQEQINLLLETYRFNQNTYFYEALSDLSDSLAELLRMRKEQLDDLRTLRPPVVESSFFWSDPKGSILEVLLFSVFGVLTNLLVNSAEYLRRNEFDESERWVAYTKLVYGPVLSVMLVFAITQGWFDLGDYQTRAYTLPLLGFIFGYASRRTVALFDRLTSRVLGAATESIKRGPKEILKRRREWQQQFEASYKARSLKDLKSTALSVANEYVKTEATGRNMS